MPDDALTNPSEFYPDDILPRIPVCPKGEGFIWITPTARLNLLAPNLPSEIEFKALIDVMTRTALFGVVDRVGYTRSQFCLLLSLLFEQRDLALGALVYSMPNGILPQYPAEIERITPKEFLDTLQAIRVRLRNEFWAALGLSFSSPQQKLLLKRFLTAYYALYHRHVLSNYLDPRVVPDPSRIPVIRNAAADFKAMADRRLHPTVRLSLHDRTGLPVDIVTRLLNLEPFGPRHDGEGYLQQRFDFLLKQQPTNFTETDQTADQRPHEDGLTGSQ